MDPRVFDHLTRLLPAPRSRRAAWRALLGLALSGGAANTTMAAVRRVPSGPRGEPCDDGSICSGDACCGDTCCPGRCFVDESTSTPRNFCCTGSNGVICGNPAASNPDELQVCCPSGGANPCICASAGAITGSYRRR
jgi:hypothetical protein